jgi:hypothetical protein
MMDRESPRDKHGCCRSAEPLRPGDFNQQEIASQLAQVPRTEVLQDFLFQPGEDLGNPDQPFVGRYFVRSFVSHAASIRKDARRRKCNPQIRKGRSKGTLPACRKDSP